MARSIAQLEAVVGRDDIVIGFGLGAEGAAQAETATALAAAAERGCMTIAFGPGAQADGHGHWLFEPPSPDPSIRQELVETLYHVLWELVHVFFEHRGLLEGPHRSGVHDRSRVQLPLPVPRRG